MVAHVAAGEAVLAPTPSRDDSQTRDESGENA
jgi:hypothetical protein